MNRQAVAVVREEWRVLDRWWTEEPVNRRYFEVVLESGQNVVVFREGARRAGGGWFSQRGSLIAPQLADMDVQGLTPEEIEVAKLAGQVYLRFKELPQAHPADLGEIAFHVHAIGRIVFARAAIRAHPEHWTFKYAARG